MEDVLDVYQHPDPLRPVVCLDETNRQLIEKRSISAEPLACKRVVKLTSTRTAVDFVHFLRELVDIQTVRF